jgi:hypothetical protein
MGRVTDHSCDTLGHSGGPIFHWFFDPAVNTIVPVVSAIISHPAFVNDFGTAQAPGLSGHARHADRQWFLFFPRKPSERSDAPPPRHAAPGRS